MPDAMHITDIIIRLCRHEQAAPMADSAMRDGHGSALEFLVIEMTTDDGLTAASFGFAGRGARAAGEIAAASLKPFFLGRDPLAREKAWLEWRVADRWWHHVPIYAYGPFDVVCWLLAAEAAGQPLYQYIGEARDAVPAYVSSLVLADPAAYAAEALATRDAGFKAYKLHPPGRSLAEDMAAHEAAREAVGPGFTLMSDPVAAHKPSEAMRLGRLLERLDYLWLEEPLFDSDIDQLRRLTQSLDIDIVGCEVMAKPPYSHAPYIATGAVDRVRADVSWSGGITGTLKVARTAEAFGMNCEIHTAIYHPLDLVNLHVACAIGNCDYFELLTPVDQFAFGLARPIPIANGIAHPPGAPGLGIDLDWDFIEKATFAVL